MSNKNLMNSINLLIDEVQAKRDFLLGDIEETEDVFSRVAYLHVKLFGEESVKEDNFAALIYVLREAFDFSDNNENIHNMFHKTQLFARTLLGKRKDKEEKIETSEKETLNSNQIGSGFIYILMNPSMEGLIKIGKTTRQPEDRINELSKATGVPTPFTLVYKEYFEDCSRAEYIIHNLLEEKGYRVSSNREFFNIPIYEAITLIQKVKHNFPNEFESTTYNKNTHKNEIIDVMKQIVEEAEEYIGGYGEKLEDVGKGLQLLIKAGKMGSAKACRILGKLYLDDNKVPVNIEKALSYFKEGSKLNGQESNFCLLEMERIYSGTNIYSNPKFINQSNAIKCWNLYLNRLQEDIHFTNHKDVVEIIHFLRDKHKNLESIIVNNKILNRFRYELHKESTNNLLSSIEDLNETIDYYSESEEKESDYWVNYSEKEVSINKKISDFIKNKFPIDDDKKLLEATILNLYHFDEEHIKVEIEIHEGNLFPGDVIEISGYEDDFIHRSTTVKRISKNEEIITIANSGEAVDLICAGNFNTFNFNYKGYGKNIIKLGTE